MIKKLINKVSSYAEFFKENTQSEQIQSKNIEITSEILNFIENNKNNHEILELSSILKPKSSFTCERKRKNSIAKSSMRAYL